MKNEERKGKNMGIDTGDPKHDKNCTGWGKHDPNQRIWASICWALC